MVQVLGTESDINLLSLVIGAVRQIGDKRPEVLTALIALVASNPSEKVRLESLEAVTELDLAAFPVRRMLDCYAAEEKETVRQALVKGLAARLKKVRPEQMAELTPLLRHKDSGIVLLGLQVVLDRKGEAAGVSDEVAALVKQPDVSLRGEACRALKAMGPDARKCDKCVPTLLEALKDLPRATDADRVPVALTIVAIETRDAKVVQAVLPVLLQGLHPDVLYKVRTPEIHEALASIGQPAVDGIIALLDAKFAKNEYRGPENIKHRRHLFEALKALGPECKSEKNYKEVERLWNREKEGVPPGTVYAGVVTAAKEAMLKLKP
jgi:hypothetical protein